MSILFNLSSLALGGISIPAMEATGRVTGGTLLGFVKDRFSDPTQLLQKSLQRANDRAWRAFEIALAGDSWWEQCKVTLARGEERGFRNQVQAFLSSVTLNTPEEFGPSYTKECLQELQAARKANVLSGGSFHEEKLAQQAEAISKLDDPQKLLRVEWKAIEFISMELNERGYKKLAQLLNLKPGGNSPLIVVAIRYFFRREVETNSELFQGLTYSQLEQLHASQQQGFAALANAIEEQGSRLEELLTDVQTVAVETHGNVLDIKEEMERQGQHLQELSEAIYQILQQHQLENREVKPADSFSMRGNVERQELRSLTKQYRAIPEEKRRQMPALLNAVGKLQVVAGDLEDAQRDFQQVATLVEDSSAQAEALANAAQAALEQRNWSEGLRCIVKAAELDPLRFEPFPLGKFEPLEILGAGGFGVAYLCRNRHSGSQVVIKTLRLDTLDRKFTDVFLEAQVLEELSHPSIIRIRDCDFAGPDRTRPFFVMDYFPGNTLQGYVETAGTLGEEEAIPLATMVAEGLQAAHLKGVLHRDVKPANLLVRWEGKWDVKLIDFGLAMATDTLTSTARSQRDHTITSESIAGTIDYAAPEQMGRLPGFQIGPYSDVYGYAKTICFALFKTPQPTFQHWQKLRPELAELLGQCLSEDPKERPGNFSQVLEKLGTLHKKWVETVEVEPIPTEVLPVAQPIAPPNLPPPLPPQTPYPERRPPSFQPEPTPRRGRPGPPPPLPPKKAAKKGPSTTLIVQLVLVLI